MSELNELYQEVILDHNKNPRNFREMETATNTADGNNPLCGDALRVYVEMEDDTVKDVAFKGSGCAIQQSVGFDDDADRQRQIEGRSRNFVRRISQNGDGRTRSPKRTKTHLGKLKIFAGVFEFPARVKCASLSWHTLHAALSGEEEISTE